MAPCGRVACEDVQAQAARSQALVVLEQRPPHTSAPDGRGRHRAVQTRRNGGVFALAAGLLAVGRVGAPHPGALDGRGWRQALVPPWLWSAERLVGFAILNIGLAVGIPTTFDHGA